jgi:hypothetical protein
VNGLLCLEHEGSEFALGNLLIWMVGLILLMDLGNLLDLRMLLDFELGSGGIDGGKFKFHLKLGTSRWN